MLAAWPRITCRPLARVQQETGRPEEAAHFQWLRFHTEEELHRAAWLRARSRGFRLPASIAILVLAEGRASNCSSDGSRDADVKPDGTSDTCKGQGVAYLHIAVNHAVTDAASIVPLVADILELHKVARAARAASPSGSGVGMKAAGFADSQVQAIVALAAAALPPALDGLEVQHSRLCNALLSPVSSGGVDSTIDLAHNAFHPRRRGYDHYIKLLPGACRVLDVASRVLGAPADHLLVVALAAAFGQISGRADVKLSLIVPMRDARGENQVVANLATTRHLSIFIGGGRSLVSVALELSARLRRREWTLCDVLGDDGDRFFINVRGIPGFEGATPVMEAVDTARKPTRFVRNLIEMFADQETADSWTLWMGIREDLDGSALARALQRVLWGMAVDPLENLALAPEPSPVALT